MSYPVSRRPKFLCALLILALTPLAALPLQAQSVWDGGGDGVSWSDAANWDPDGVPTNATDVELDGGASIQLDVAAATHDLALNDATLDGPGDLTVEGAFDWFEGTVGGDGVLTVTGSMTFLEGPDKVIGRQIELVCDAVWEESHILYDIAAGGALHHHAGFVFSIVDHGSNRPGEESESDFSREFVTPSGERIRASHLDAPLIGEDITADMTDVYVISLEGTLLSETTVMHEVSTRINGTFQLTGGTTIFGSGSEFGIGSIFQMSAGTEAILDEGTHIAQGGMQVVSGEVPEGVTLTGDQTIYILDPEGVPDTPFSLRGPTEMGDGAEIDGPVDIDAETTISGPNATFGQVNVQQSSIELLLVNGTLVNVSELNWNDGQIRLSNGGSLNAENVIVDQANTNLEMNGDGDPGATESFTVSNLLQVVRTGEVPPRTDLNFGFPNGARYESGPSTEFVFRGGGTIGGEVSMGSGATMRLRNGIYDFETTSTLAGGRVVIENGASAYMSSPTIDELVSVILAGDLGIDGVNDLPGLGLYLQGGRILGLGNPIDAIRARVEFSPESSVQRAAIEDVSVEFTDGSKWTNGHIDLKNGATATVTAGANFVVSHAATNLQVTEDGNAAEEERWFIDGTLTVDQTASVPPALNVPTTVNPGGRFVVEPGSNVNVPNVMTVLGKLLLRGGAGMRFTFVDSEVAPGGCLAGDGTITQAINGNLILNGTVSPGENPGDRGDLTFIGPTQFGSTAVTEFDFRKDGATPLESDHLQFNDATNLAGKSRVRVDAAGAVDEVVTIVDGSNVTGEWLPIEVEGGSEVGFAYLQDSIEAAVDRSESLNIILCGIFVDVDRDGVGDTGGSGVVLELVDTALNVIATIVTNQDGSGRFELDLDPGQYVVRALLQPNDLEPLSPPTNEITVIITEQAVNGLAFFNVVRNTEKITVTNLEQGGPGSLFVAIEEANESESPWVDIEFLEVSGVITYDTPLPSLRKQIRLYTSDSGSLLGDGAPAITLDGTNCVGCDGLVFSAGESAVRGIAIESFDGYGIVIEDSDLTIVRDTRITGNGAGGVLIRSGNDNQVGAGPNELSNEITGNGGPGITVLDGKGHDFRGNSIYANLGLAIDLGDDGETPNDFRDVDAGPNGLQNAPVLTDADPLGLDVSGSLESRPLSEYVIEIYGNEACIEDQPGDLQVLLGSATVVTDVDGLVDFVVETIPYAGELSAIATAVDGSTSEASACLMSVVTDVVDSGAQFEFVHQAYPNPTPGPTTLAFQMPKSGPVEASLHDVTGRRVVTIFEGDLEAGRHEIEWDGRDERGRLLANGVFFYKLRMGGRDVKGRVVTMR